MELQKDVSHYLIHLHGLNRKQDPQITQLVFEVLKPCIQNGRYYKESFLMKI